MVEFIAMEFFHLFRTSGQSFTHDEDWGWYTVIDKRLNHTNYPLLCFEKASCWDYERHQHNYISLPTGKRCKSILKVVTKHNLNVTSSKSIHAIAWLQTVAYSYNF